MNTQEVILELRMWGENWKAMRLSIAYNDAINAANDPERDLESIAPPINTWYVQKQNAEEIVASHEQALEDYVCDIVCDETDCLYTQDRIECPLMQARHEYIEDMMSND